jgi:hypothetical protein
MLLWSFFRHHKFDLYSKNATDAAQAKELLEEANVLSSQVDGKDPVASDAPHSIS